MSRSVNFIPNPSIALVLACLCAALVGPVSADTDYSKVPGVDCVINPFRVADVSSPVVGVIEQLLVTRSEQVTAGQPIAQLNADVERANVELAKYRADIRSEIELGRVNADFDTNRKQRIAALYQQQVIAVEDVDEVERESRLSRWRLVQARELAKVRQLELKRAREQLHQKTIKAPFDGFVIDTFKEPGEHVEDQAILRLAQLDPLVVEAIVPMEYFGEVKTDMLAEIVPEILVNERLTGRVTIIDRIGDTASNTFGVRLVLDNPQYRIPAGLKCVVKFKNSYQHQARVSDGNQVPAPTAAAPRQTILASESMEPGSAEQQPETTTVVTASTAVSHKDSKAISYLVLAGQGKSRQDTLRIIDQLYDAGVEDLLEMSQGPYKGLISLGLFNNRVNADRRRENLEKLGFNVFIRELP